MSIVLLGSTSGSITLQEPAVAGSTVLNLPAISGTVSINGPAFSAYQNSAQSLTGSVFTKITFDTEEFDTNNNFASSTFTPTVAGYYQINFAVSGAVSNTAVLSGLYKNGSVYKYGSMSTGTINAGLSVGSSLVYFNGSTDYVEIYAFTGATQNTSPSIATVYINGCLVRTA